MHRPTTMTLTLSATSALSWGACKKGTVNYHPGLYQYSASYCEVGNSATIDISASVMDLNNNSWYGNYSYAYNYTDNYWENYTSCYNYGTPTCYNNTGTHSYNFGFGWNSVRSLNWTTGTGSFTLWSNGTKMVAGHHYVLVLYISANSNAFAAGYNLAAHFTASAKAALSCSGTTNGMNLVSVTVT